MRELEIPEDVKKSLNEGNCLVCCNSVVLCMSDDFPVKEDFVSVTEVDRTSSQILLRHIIYDEPDNPLTVEYSADREFITKIINNGKVKVVFLDKYLTERVSLYVNLSKEEISIMKREASVP